MPGGNDSNSPKIHKISDIEASKIGPKPGKNAVDTLPEYSEKTKADRLATEEFKGLPPKGAKG